MVQRQVLYLGEINDSQQEAWCRVIEAFDERAQQTTQLALFPADWPAPDYAEGHGVQIRLGAMQLHRPRQWGACWLACQLYEQLELDRFWAARLPNSRKGTCWSHILETLVCYRLIDPGSEWRLHRLWFEQSAMGDLLGEDFALVEKERALSLPRQACRGSAVHASASALAGSVRRPLQVLLYDLTSTYFESDPPSDDSDSAATATAATSARLRAGGHCALSGSRRAFRSPTKILPGITRTRRHCGLPAMIEAQYGKAQRIWVMDRGINT